MKATPIEAASFELLDLGWRIERFERWSDILAWNLALAGVIATGSMIDALCLDIEREAFARLQGA